MGRSLGLFLRIDLNVEASSDLFRFSFYCFGIGMMSDIHFKFVHGRVNRKINWQNCQYQNAQGSLIGYTWIPSCEEEWPSSLAGRVHNGCQFNPSQFSSPL